MKSLYPEILYIDNCFSVIPSDYQRNVAGTERNFSNRSLMTSRVSFPFRGFEDRAHGLKNFVHHVERVLNRDSLLP